jgi:hypothetical protein
VFVLGGASFPCIIISTQALQSQHQHVHTVYTRIEKPPQGGYNLTATACSVEACIRVLLGDAPPPLQPPLVPTAVGLHGIARALAVHGRCVLGIHRLANPISDNAALRILISC